MKIWDRLQELVECVSEGEIDDNKHIEFIMNLFDNLDPHNAEEELTERQLKWLDWLWGKYCDGGDCDW